VPGEPAQMTFGMTNVPAARFEETATEQGSRGLLASVGTFVETYGVDAVDREQIAHTLAAILGVAAGHASAPDDVRIAVTADVMPADVQLVLRLCPGGASSSADGADPIGGLELWISFPRN
jgi:hypothetical protein